jgi:hypothetical protein
MNIRISLVPATVMLTTAFLYACGQADQSAPPDLTQADTAAVEPEVNDAQQRQDAIPDTTGTGPFPALKEIDPGLSDQVVYRPADLEALGETKLGIYAFGNGSCSNDGASQRLHLLQVASHGYLAIAPGGIFNGPGKSERPADTLPTRAEQLREAIDWALAENTRAGSKYFGHIDPSAIAISGYSCGGLQMLLVADDPRVKTGVMMNSGLFLDGPTTMGDMSATKEILADLHFPTLYILGGETDIAYPNGMDDFAKINHVPVVVANIDTGHGGTYWDPNGGAAALVVIDWLNWRLRGDTEAGQTFLGENCGLCLNPQWLSFETKGFEMLDSQ